MKTGRWLTVLLAISAAITLLTFSIAVPIVCRPFYYVQIGSLNLPETTGLTEEEIKTAYNEMLDYCLGAEEFSAGILPWSESGKSHFTDVRVLFLLDLRVLACNAAILIFLIILSHVIHRKCAPILRRGPCFWSGAGLGLVFILIGGLVALDFDRAFNIFHAIFFPGKDNWVFDPATDPIINILPEEYFLNCAILIFAILIFGCIILIAADFLLFHRQKNVCGRRLYNEKR